MSQSVVHQYDAVVLGGGIAGLQSALELADQGRRVAVIEKDPSVGGKMIRLSKVFPTLDCASCITTPKMSAAAHHPNITLLTMCEVMYSRREENGVSLTVRQSPRYVDEDKCIGCRQCEYACPSLTPDHEQGGLTARKAIYIPFSNAIPQKAVLDVENCTLCGKCSSVCPTDALVYDDAPREFTIQAGTVVVSTGYELMEDYPRRAWGDAARQPNLITSLQMERILAPHGPYMRVLRPSDGKAPDSVAFIQCAGSRDIQLGVGYCSRVCCMYAIKQAMLLSGALPLADLTIYYIDIRAFGKNYEQFFQNAKAMGVEFVKAKPSVVGQAEDQGVILRYEDQMEGRVMERTHDLVVMSLAMLPAARHQASLGLSPDPDGFTACPQPHIAPAATALEGVYSAGAASGPKDIVDTIVEAGHAAMEAGNYLDGRKPKDQAA